MPAIQLHGVSVQRRTAKLLSDVSIDIRRGRVVGIIGPNGAGKSTLLKVLAGEITSDAGIVTIDGHDLRTYRAPQLAAFRAVVPQSTALAFPFTALEVVELGGCVPGFGLADRRIRSIASAALDVVGMGGLADRLYTDLSGGERQRVHFSRALCQLDCAASMRTIAPILLLDEPTASLDLAHQIAVLDEAQRRARSGAAVVAVLHDLNLAARYADEIILLSRGKVAVRCDVAAAFDDTLLSDTFEVRTKSNCVPQDGMPFLLPQVIQSLKRQH